MEHTERNCCLKDLTGDIQISSIENAILETLRTNICLVDPIIDISLIQEKCLEQDISIEEFSHGFVLLLTRRLIEPHGEFRYALLQRGA